MSLKKFFSGCLLVAFVLFLVAVCAGELYQATQAFDDVARWFSANPIKAVCACLGTAALLIIIFALPNTSRNETAIDHNDPIEPPGGGNF